MREDGGFCLKYCWCCFNVLYSRYTRNHILFSLTLPITHKSLIRLCFANQEETTVNILFFLLDSSKVQKLLHIFLISWHRFNKNLSSLLAGYNWKHWFWTQGSFCLEHHIWEWYSFSQKWPKKNQKWADIFKELRLTLWSPGLQGLFGKTGLVLGL